MPLQFRKGNLDMRYITLKLKKQTTHKDFEQYESLISNMLHCATIFIESNSSDKYIELDNRIVDSVSGYLHNPEELKKHNDLFVVFD